MQTVGRGAGRARSGATSGAWLRRGLSVAVAVCIVASCARSTRSASSATSTTGVTVSATAGSTPSTPATTGTFAGIAALTALGDSVPHGTACSCTPYPELTAADIAGVVHHPVSSSDDAVNGYRSIDVLQQLQGGSTAADIEKADIVTIQIGANDVAFSSTCGLDVACYESKLPTVDDNVVAIVARVRSLHSGRRIVVVLLDYSDVWLGGQTERAEGAAYEAAASSVTRAFGVAIRSVAESTGSIYVGLQAAFRGPRGDADDSGLLADDGDHPNAAGHTRIAQTIIEQLVIA